MKAAYIEQVRPPENIRYGERPAPTVGPHDVLVKVAAVCVNPIDVYIRSGRFPLSLPYPFIIGRDMPGIVQEIGASVKRFVPGDRVWCNNQGYSGRQGIFSECVAVNEQLLYALPPGVEERELVAFVHSALTACIGLRLANISPGETIFVNGGSGNVGSALVQLALGRGARVFATAGSPAGVDWCRSLGAEAVNYKEGNVDAALAAFAPGGIDVYWDTSAQPYFDFALEKMASGGRLIVMAGLGARPPFPVGPFDVKGCSMFGFAITHATEDDLTTSAKAINSWIAAGKLRVRIDRVLPFSAAATAHRLVEEKAPLVGKVVLVP